LLLEEFHFIVFKKLIIFSKFTILKINLNSRYLNFQEISFFTILNFTRKIKLAHFQSISDIWDKETLKKSLHGRKNQ